MTLRGKQPRPVGLSGLRGFEAAARHLSFTLAAEELNLTQSSISRQIRTLEDQVGRPLFRRRTRALELTPAGEHFQRVVRATLADLDRAVGDIRRGPGRSRVTISTFATFASLMLVPRLTHFSANHPEIDIQIDASDDVRDLEADGFDLAIRYLRRERAPRDALLLQGDPMLPVLAPALLARIGPVIRPADFARATMLVHDYGARYTVSQSWQTWFQAVGEPMPLEAATISVNFTYQALEAALRGQGVVLAPLIFAREHLARGELVAPIPVISPSPHGYYLIANPATAETLPVAAFARWLIDEIRRDGDVEDGLGGLPGVARMAGTTGVTDAGSAGNAGSDPLPAR